MANHPDIGSPEWLAALPAEHREAGARFAASAQPLYLIQTDETGEDALALVFCDSGDFWADAYLPSEREQAEAVVKAWNDRI